jgi:hypothetical protein
MSMNTAGMVARMIGNALSDAHPTLNILWYGDAHPDRLPLAVVRREQTNFFQSDINRLGQRDLHKEQSTHDEDKTLVTIKSNTIRNDGTSNFVGSCTIGAPSYFVENYNIRLDGYDKPTARSLTQRLRRTWPGGNIVEGLTLPYNQRRASGGTRNVNNMRDYYWEVACNILRPDLVSHADLQAVADEWYKEQPKTHFQLSTITTSNFETVAVDSEGDHTCNNIRSSVQTLPPYGYRVGTSISQCHEALMACSINSASVDNHQRKRHDQVVRQRMESYMNIMDVDK